MASLLRGFNKLIDDKYCRQRRFVTYWDNFTVSRLDKCFKNSKLIWPPSWEFIQRIMVGSCQTLRLDTYLDLRQLQASTRTAPRHLWSHWFTVIYLHWLLELVSIQFSFLYRQYITLVQRQGSFCVAWSKCC